MRARLVAVAALVAALWVASLGMHGIDDGTGRCAVAPPNTGRVVPDERLVSKRELACERAALVALYEATDGDKWRRNENWLSDEPVGDWQGVVTDHHGRVVVLELWGNEGGSRGTIPPELLNLTNLRSLVLGGMDLTGPIPAELGSLTMLRVLSLSGSGLTGQIPPELGQLRELRVLSLVGNHLSGPIPSELGRLTEIRELHLGHNQLRGTIPPELGNLVNARLLGLEYNDLAGPIPETFSRLTELRGLYLSGNQLTGPVPEWISGLSHLEELALGGIGLAGEIPDELGELPALAFLDLCHNQLVGRIPVWVGGVNERGAVWLGGNALDAPLPCVWGEPFRLNPNVWLPLSCEEDIFRDCVREQPAASPALASPAALQRERDALAALYHSTNGKYWFERWGWLRDRPVSSWRGVETGPDGRVIALDLDRNNLRGTIPRELGDLQNLRSLSLADNALSGPIPPELGSLWRLTSLNLHNNDLAGGIPAELGNLTQLSSLSVCGNQLSGIIPAELASQWRLRYAFVFAGNDELLGSLPHSSFVNYVATLGGRYHPCD